MPVKFRNIDVKRRRHFFRKERICDLRLLAYRSTSRGVGQMQKQHEMAHGKQRGRMGYMWRRAHTYQRRVHLGRPRAAQKFLPSAWSTSIPRWLLLVGGAPTAYISAHSTSHPALRGTPFASTIHPSSCCYPSWRARPRYGVRSSWDCPGWELGGGNKGSGGRYSRLTRCPGRYRNRIRTPRHFRPREHRTTLLHIHPPFSLLHARRRSDCFFLRLAPEISEESHDHACRFTDVPRARNVVYLHAEYRIFLPFSPLASFTKFSVTWTQQFAFFHVSGKTSLLYLMNDSHDLQII